MSDTLPRVLAPISVAEQPGRSSKIQLSSLNEHVYDLLWQRIATHALRPGDKLSDVHLSEELGVSRTPVREALHRLAQDGIVRSESRRGFYVASFSSQDVREIYDLRAALEVLAVQLACPSLDPTALDQAQRDLDDVARQVAAGDDKARETFLRIDREFHQLLLATANNSRLASSMASLQAQISVFQVYGIHLKAIVTQSIEHHQAIMAALHARDCAAAAQAMERHIHEIKAWVLSEFIHLEANRRGA
jgi:DNA-binding GntR family transcriptional regulator